MENLNKVFLVILLKAICGCGHDTPEKDTLAHLQEVEGYLTYMSGWGHIDYSIRNDDNAPVFQAVKTCADLPESLRKNTKILFSGILVEQDDANYSYCIDEFEAIDLCNNPELTPGFNEMLHPICIYAIDDVPFEVNDFHLRNSTSLAETMDFYDLQLHSPVDFATQDVVFLRQGLQPSGWDVVVEYSCDEGSKQCLFKHTIREWNSSQVGGGLNFFYAIQKVPEEYTLVIEKENLPMN